MTDDKKLRRPFDAQKINLTQAYEVGRWLTKFGFKTTEILVLDRIIKALGTNQADKVSEWIKKNKRGIVKRWRDEYQINIK
jgi:ABC-type proline/glycine betaine transport system substrate-binding protein